jgi:hypothetical protein
MGQEAKRADAIVQGHDDNAATFGELRAVIVVALAAEQTAAMKPDHHRTRCSIWLHIGRVHIEIEAILCIARGGEDTTLRLRTGAPERGGLQGAAPAVHYLRRAPA